MMQMKFIFYGSANEILGRIRVMHGVVMVQHQKILKMSNQGNFKMAPRQWQGKTINGIKITGDPGFDSRAGAFFLLPLLFTDGKAVFNNLTTIVKL